MTLTQIGTGGIKDDAVTSGKIPANAVESSEIADQAVSSSKIANGAVTGIKIGPNVVTATHIDNNTIVTGNIADEAVTLAKLEHGTSSNDGKFLRANNGADPTFETVSIPAGVGGANGADFDDNVKVRLGTGNDLEVFHNGTNSHLRNQTGDLIIDSNSSGSVKLRPKIGEEGVVANTDGSVDLYHDGSKKFETYANGCTVTGNLNAGNVDLADNAKARFGGSNDIEIFHDGSDSRIHNTTGNFLIRNEAASGNIFLRTKTSESAIDCVPDGAVNLYYDGSKKLETKNNGVNIQGVNSVNTTLEMHGHQVVGRSYWGYSTGYNGVTLGRTDVGTASTIFMGVDVTGNSSGSFGGQGNEIVFRNNHQFVTPNAANNNYNTMIRFGRGTSTEGAVNFPHGCLFGQDQADANILHDYEEGSWTPVLNSGTVSTNNAKYIRIGGMCYINASFTNPSDTTSSTDILIRASSLPFSKSAFADNLILGTCPHRYFSYSSKDTLMHWMMNGSGIHLQSSNDAVGDKAFSSVKHQHIDASYSDWSISGWYTV